MNRAALPPKASRRISHGPAGLVERYGNWLAGAVILLALGLRLAALLSFKKSLYFDFLLWDERLYHVWAEKIARGIFHGSSVYEFAPLPAYLYAAVYKLFGVETLYVRIANVVLGTASCWLITLIGTRLGGRWVGLVSGLIAAVYKPFIFYSVVLLKASLSVFLFSAAVYSLLCVLEKRSPAGSLLLGVCLGAMLNVRPQAGVVLPLALFAVAWAGYRARRAKKALAVDLLCYGGGFFVAVFPFLARNYRVAGEAALMASQSGFNLYLGNNLENRDPYYLPVPFASSSPFEQGVQFTIEASRRLGKRLSAREASSYWRQQVIRNIKKYPRRFADKIVQKILAVFQPFQPSDHFNIGFLGRFVPFFKLPFPGFTLLVPCGLAGLLAAVSGSGKIRVLLAAVVLYGLTLVVFFTNTRYRLPLMAIVLPGAALGLCNVITLVRRRALGKVALYAGIALTVTAIECLPVRAKGDMTAYYNTHAIVLARHGRQKEAMAYWRLSSETKGRYSAFANLSLAGRYAAADDWKKAAHYLGLISEDSFAAAPKYALLGNLMLKKDEIQEAIGAYEKSLQINSGQRRTRFKLAGVYRRIDQNRAAEEYEKLKYIASFYREF